MLEWLESTMHMMSLGITEVVVNKVVASYMSPPCTSQSDIAAPNWPLKMLLVIYLAFISVEFAIALWLTFRNTARTGLFVSRTNTMHPGVIPLLLVIQE